MIAPVSDPPALLRRLLDEAVAVARPEHCLPPALADCQDLQAVKQFVQQLLPTRRDTPEYLTTIYPSRVPIAYCALHFPPRPKSLSRSSP